MYGDIERPNARRIALTFVGILTAIVVVVLAASFAFGQFGKAERPRDSVGPVLRGSSVVGTGAADTAVLATLATEPTLDPPFAAPSSAATTKSSITRRPGGHPVPTGSSAVVVIDAGHQGRGDSSLEPIGPGSSEKKPKVAGGATGVAPPRLPEGQVTLDVALKLEKALKAQGVKVIMVRRTQDVNIANSERAAVANEANATLFIRLHCDGAENSTTRGLSTLVPARNQWTGPIVAESAKAGKLIHAAAVSSTGAIDRGVVGRTDMSGFNWSKVPTVLVEMGFMSHPDESRLLYTDAYQLKLAQGIAAGILEYIR